MHEFRLDLAWFNNFLNLSDDILGTCGHISVEISGSFVKVQVTEGISLLSFNQSEIGKDGLLFDIFFTIEYLDIFRL
jgi:hypothetical protein